MKIISKPPFIGAIGTCETCGVTIELEEQDIEKIKSMKIENLVPPYWSPNKTKTKKWWIVSCPVCSNDIWSTNGAEES
jgi:hypothetical protein